MTLIADIGFQENGAATVYDGADAGDNDATITGGGTLMTAGAKVTGPGGSLTNACAGAVFFSEPNWLLLDSALHVADNANYTLQFFAKLTGTDAIIFHDSGGDWIITLSSAAGGSISILEGDVSLSGVTLTNWNHYAIRFHSDGTTDLYLNAISKGAFSGAARSEYSYDKIFNGDFGAVDGSLAGLRAYDEIRSQGQIATDALIGGISTGPLAVTRTPLVGSPVAYNASADTNAARGTALLAAIDDQTEGDAYELEAGTFALGSGTIGITESGITLSGAGQTTIITANGNAITLDTDLSDFTIEDMTVTVADLACISGSSNYENVTARRLWLNGVGDAFTLDGFVSGLILQDLVTTSEFDNIVSSGEDVLIEDCTCTNSGTFAGAHTTGIVLYGDATIRGVTINVVNAVNKNAVGIDNRGDGTVDVESGAIVTSESGAGTAYDLVNSGGGTLKVHRPEVSYEPTKTSGLITTVTAPTAIALSANTLPDGTDTTGGYAVGTLSTTDPDAGDTFTYTIVGGADQAKFSIDGATLKIDDGVLVWSTKHSYNVTVRSTDAAGLTVDQAFVVHVRVPIPGNWATENNRRAEMMWNPMG